MKVRQEITLESWRNGYGVKRSYVMDNQMVDIPEKELHEIDFDWWDGRIDPREEDDIRIIVRYFSDDDALMAECSKWASEIEEERHGMKKIINGRIYDTASAECVGEWGEKLNLHFEFCTEDLYRKRTGEFFLHGQGGAMSKYAVDLGGGSWKGGEKIIPLTYEEAQKWAEDHLTEDEYEKLFGKVEEDKEKKQVLIKLSFSAIEKMKRGAGKAGTSMSAYIEDLINMYSED